MFGILLFFRGFHLKCKVYTKKMVIMCARWSAVGEEDSEAHRRIARHLLGWRRVALIWHLGVFLLYENYARYSLIFLWCSPLL